MSKYLIITNPTAMKSSFFCGDVPKNAITVFDKFEVTKPRILCRIDAYARTAAGGEAIKIELWDGATAVATILIAATSNEGSWTGMVTLETGKTYYLRTNQTTALTAGGDINITWQIDQA